MLLGAQKPIIINVSEFCTKKPNQITKSLIKMNNRTVRELRDVAKKQVLRGYYKLRKADLIASLSEQSTKELPSEQSTQKKGQYHH